MIARAHQLVMDVILYLLQYRDTKLLMIETWPQSFQPQIIVIDVVIWLRLWKLMIIFVRHSKYIFII